MSVEAEEGLALADVISAIKRELQVYVKATNDGRDLGLELTEVEVVLAVKNVKTADGSINFGISFFGIGAKAGGEAKIVGDNVSTLSVKLAPPKLGVLLAAEDVKHMELASTLTNARSQLLAGLSEEPILVPKSLSLELKFVVSKSGGPKGEFEFKIISGKASGTISSANTQTVKLTFKEPDDL